MKNWFCAFNTMMLCCSVLLAESITEPYGDYKKNCINAAVNSSDFQNFRSTKDYVNALELPGDAEFAEFLLKNASKNTIDKLNSFQRLEKFGNPSTSVFPGIGRFSGTTLRYIVIADQIKKLFSLPNGAKIVEIGAGFGGQSFILSQLQSFSKYYVYDLPEAEALIERTAKELPIENVICLPLHSELPEESVDLVISNYAFSECGRVAQMEYFEKVIKKSVRGYMIYNQIAENVFSMDYLSPVEFIKLLKENGMNPKIHNEPIKTFDGNMLIVWDRTR